MLSSELHQLAFPLPASFDSIDSHSSSTCATSFPDYRLSVPEWSRPAVSPPPVPSRVSIGRFVYSILMTSSRRVSCESESERRTGSTRIEFRPLLLIGET
jgi:hypothetical protein